MPTNNQKQFTHNQTKLSKSERYIAPHLPTLPERLEYILEHYRATDDGGLYYKRKYGGREIPGHNDGKGYLRVKIYFPEDRSVYIYKHRILFALYHGRFPYPECDHIDQNRLNNSKDNLRDATPSENAKNCFRSKKRNSKSKYYGVHWSGPRQLWNIRVYLDGVVKYLGSSKDELEGARMYNEYIIKNNIQNRYLNDV